MKKTNLGIIFALSLITLSFIWRGLFIEDKLEKQGVRIHQLEVDSAKQRAYNLSLLSLLDEMCLEIKRGRTSVPQSRIETEEFEL